MRCGAKKRNGQPCRQWPIKGRTRCRLHGGKSRLGAGASSFVHGRYSKSLPTRLAAHYEAAAHDPRLLELRDEIATVDARIIDLLQRVDRGESGALWREAQAAMTKFRQEQAKNHVEGMRLALMEAERLILEGAGDYAGWGEIQDLIEQRRKLCDSENRRLVQAHEMITSAQAMVLLSQVVAAIQRHVTDKTILAAIAHEFQGLGHYEGNGHYALSDDAC
jgi:hypothetical protein